MTSRTKAVALTAIAALALLLAIALWPRPTASPDPQTSRMPDASLPPDAPVAVFIGDSYTVGTGTSLDGSGFPAILGERRGWRVVNLAIPGTGYATGREDGLCPPAGCTAYVGMLADAAAHDPDVVIVSGGRNDLARQHLEPAVVAFYRELRQQLPDARLVVTSPLWDDSPTPQSLVELRRLVEREATAAGAEYLDLGDLFAGRPDLIAPDDLHPDEEGLALIAARIDELLPSPLVE